MLVLVATLGAACTSGDDVTEPAASPSVDPVASVERFDPSVNARTAIGSINTAARQDPDRLRQVAMDHLDASDPDIRWAAVYALSLTATPDHAASMDALTERLSAPDPDERLNAAAALVALGDKEGIPVLIDLLGTEEPLRYLVLPAWRVAADVLLRYTDADFGILDAVEPDARSEAIAAWEDWWERDGGALTWDVERGRFT